MLVILFSWKIQIKQLVQKTQKDKKKQIIFPTSIHSNKYITYILFVKYKKTFHIETTTYLTEQKHLDI